MDEEFTLHDLRRFEAERKLRAMPAHIFETAWVREAQIEAVVDAVIAVSCVGDAAAYAHARHVGEWCARIAGSLACGPDRQLARRVGVLAGADPAALERIDELVRYAPFVRDYQSWVMLETKNPRTTSLIVSVADEFDTRVARSGKGNEASPSAALRSMAAQADEAQRPIVEALSIAVGLHACMRVA